MEGCPTSLRSTSGRVGTTRRCRTSAGPAWAIASGPGSGQRAAPGQHRGSPYGPDLIGLLRNNTSYGVAGDHGGINRTVQEIPIVFAGAGTSAEDRTVRIRTVDIMPTILEIMGIEPVNPWTDVLLP